MPLEIEHVESESFPEMSDLLLRLATDSSARTCLLEPEKGASLSLSRNIWNLAGGHSARVMTNGVNMGYPPFTAKTMLTFTSFYLQLDV